MDFAVARVLACAVLMLAAAAPAPQSGAVQQIDLADRLAAGKLRAVNREVTRLQGSRDGVHVSEKTGPGVVWIEGRDLFDTVDDVLRRAYRWQRRESGRRMGEADASETRQREQEDPAMGHRKVFVCKERCETVGCLGHRLSQV